MSELKEHWSSRQVEFVAGRVWQAPTIANWGVVTMAAYAVTERLKGFPVCFKGLGWEQGICMILADLVEREVMPWYQKSYGVAPTRDTAERVAERLIYLCAEHPREKA